MGLIASYPGSRVGGGERAWYQPIGNHTHLYIITRKGDTGTDKAKGNNTAKTHYNYNHKLF